MNEKKDFMSLNNNNSIESVEKSTVSFYCCKSCKRIFFIDQVKLEKVQIKVDCCVFCMEEDKEKFYIQILPATKQVWKFQIHGLQSNVSGLQEIAL